MRRRVRSGLHKHVGVTKVDAVMARLLELAPPEPKEPDEAGQRRIDEAEAKRARRRARNLS